MNNASVPLSTYKTHEHNFDDDTKSHDFPLWVEKEGMKERSKR